MCSYTSNLYPSTFSHGSEGASACCRVRGRTGETRHSTPPGYYYPQNYNVWEEVPMKIIRRLSKIFDTTTGEIGAFLVVLLSLIAYCGFASRFGTYNYFLFPRSLIIIWIASNFNCTFTQALLLIPLTYIAFCSFAFVAKVGKYPGGLTFPLMAYLIIAIPLLVYYLSFFRSKDWDSFKFEGGLIIFANTMAFLTGVALLKLYHLSNLFVWQLVLYGILAWWIFTYAFPLFGSLTRPIIL